MGLDMYVYRTKQDIPKVGTDGPADALVPDEKYLVKGKFDYDKYSRLRSKIEVFYWRKHHELHRWFRDIWQENGGKPASDFFGDDFNGGDWVRIDADDLDTLEECVRNGIISDRWAEGFANDMKFIRKARALLKKGWKLFYTSSW